MYEDENGYWCHCGNRIKKKKDLFLLFFSFYFMIIGALVITGFLVIYNVFW